MTTEQMDWLDDERAGRHAKPGPVILFGTPTEAEVAEARGRAGSRGVLVLPEVMRESLKDHIAEADGHKDIPREPDLSKRLHNIGALRENGAVDDHALWVNAPLSIVLTEAQRARDDECAEDAPKDPGPYFTGEPTPGDDEVTEKWSGEAPSEMATMAEEPVEDRLRRAYANGWREGFDRGSRGDDRWDRW
jgi:hypothetical protein